MPVGARVRVPIGTREVVGVVVEHAERPTIGADRLKLLRGLIDQAPLFDEPLLRLLRWTAQYYHHPLGEVIAAATA